MNRNLHSRLENLLQAENIMIYNSYNLKWQVDKNCSNLYLAEPNFDIKSFRRDMRDFDNYRANQTHPTTNIQNVRHQTYAQVPDTRMNLSMTQTDINDLDVNQNYINIDTEPHQNLQFSQNHPRNPQRAPVANLPQEVPPQVEYVPVQYAPIVTYKNPNSTNNGLPQRVPLFTDPRSK